MILLSTTKSHEGDTIQSQCMIKVEQEYLGEDIVQTYTSCKQTHQKCTKFKETNASPANQALSNQGCDCKEILVAFFVEIPTELGTPWDIRNFQWKPLSI